MGHTEHASAGEQDDGELDAALARRLFPLGNLCTELCIPLTFLLDATAIVLCVGLIERGTRCCTRSLVHAQEENEYARQKRRVLAYPYGGDQAVRIEGGRGGEWGQRRVGRRVGRVLGGDEFAGREADVPVNKNHVERLCALWGPYGGT